jgi:hypothetical protein
MEVRAAVAVGAGKPLGPVHQGKSIRSVVVY